MPDLDPSFDTIRGRIEELKRDSRAEHEAQEMEQTLLELKARLRKWRRELYPGQPRSADETNAETTPE